MSKRKVFEPGSEKPYRLSRSQIEEYVQCPKCFYLNRRVGVPALPSFPFSLNSAVDSLLKTEFDAYRTKQRPHPIMVENQIDAIPFSHSSLDEWRSNFKGVAYLDEKKNLIICGAVDDLWVSPDGELHVVDYKATAKKDDVSLDAAWQAGYRRQMAIYQWLLRKNGFKVSKTGYFVYCNGDGYRETFDSTLHFRVKVIPYVADDSWVDEAIEGCYRTLNSEEMPDENGNCEVCAHRKAVRETEDLDN